MSFHQLEDFVEDSIRLLHTASIAKAEKRNLIFNLYRFQAAHDTSYTHFRLADILMENGYLYRWPIEDHPDFEEEADYFEKLDIEDGGWIQGSFNEEHEKIYAQIIAGKAYLFFDAGASFWLRVKDKLSKEDQIAPISYSAPQLFMKLLEIAAEKESDFLSTIYAVFVNAILEYYLDEADGIPQSFDSWLQDQDLLAIRAFAEKHRDRIFTDQEEEEDELLTLPDLAEEMEVAFKEDEKARLSFLLDFSIQLKEIKKKYAQAKKRKKDPAKYEVAYKYFRDRLDDSWKEGMRQQYREDQEYSFLKKIEVEDGEDLYASLILMGSEELNLISCKIGIQLVSILSWQNREANPLPEYQHFVQDLTFYLEEEEIEGNKFLHNWGGWKYDLRHSEKTLLKRVENMYALFEKHSPKVFDFYSQKLSDWASIPSQEELLQKREEALEQGLNFFGNKMDLYLCLAYVNFLEGNEEGQQMHLKFLEELYESGPGSAALRKRIEDGLSLLEGNELAYPEISTLYSMRLK